MVFGLEQEDGSFDYSHGADILSIPLKAGRGIRAETCELDYVFPPDDLGSGPCTPFIIYIPHMRAAFLLTKIYSIKETYIPKVGMTMLVYWMI